MKKGLIFSYFLLCFLILNVIKINAIVFDYQYAEYNQTINGTVELPEVNDYFARNSAINFVDFLDNELITINNASGYMSTYSGIETNNKTIRVLELTTTSNYAFNVYSYNKSLSLNEFLFHIGLIINDASINEEFSITLVSSVKNIYVKLFKYDANNYRIGIKLGAGSYTYSSSISKTYIENCEIRFGLNETYDISPYIPTFYGIGAELIYNNFSINSYKGAVDLKTSLASPFSYFQIRSTMNNISLSSIDANNYFSLDQLIENYSIYNDYKEESFSLYNCTAFQSYKTYAEDNHFERWSDNIESSEDIYASTWNDNGQQNANKWYSLSNAEVSFYNPDYEIYQPNQLIYNSTGVSYAFHPFLFDLSTTLITLEYYYYVDSTHDVSDDFEVSLATTGGSVAFKIRHTQNDLEIDYNSGTDIITDYLTNDAWNLISIYYSNTLDKLYLYLNGTYYDVYNTYTKTIGALVLQGNDVFTRYLSNMICYNYSSYTEQQGLDVYTFSYNQDFENKAYNRAIKIDMSAYVPIVFENARPESTYPSLFGNQRKYYIETEFEYTSGLTFSFNFYNVSYRLECGINTITVSSIVENNIIESYTYTKPSCFTNNVKFAIYYDYDFTLIKKPKFSLRYNNYWLALHKIIDAPLQPDDPDYCFQNLTIISNSSKEFIMKNLYTHVISQYVEGPLIDNMGRYIYYQDSGTTYPYFDSEDLDFYFNVPSIEIEGYDVFTYFTYIELTQNSTGSLDTFFMTTDYPYLNFTLEDDDSDSQTYNLSYYLVDNVYIDSYLSGLSGHNYTYTFYFHTYIFYYYIESTDDLFTMFIDFLPNLIILFIFPILFYSRFKKLGIIIGFFAGILILSVINSFNITQTLLLLLIISALSVYIYKKRSLRSNEL